MVARTSVVNMSGDHEETVERLARHLGTDKLRRKVFNVIYGRGSLPLSRKQIMKIAGISTKDGQQTQNAVDHLQKHHLIVRQDNDGFVDDGSRYVYSKDHSVRAVRKEIIKYADDRKAANAMPTKRRPTVTIVPSVRTVKRKALRKKTRLSVLYLTADPDKSNPLRVDAEVRRVQEAIRASEFRDNIGVEYRPAANLETLLNGLNECKPQIIHFSGHGDMDGIAMDNADVGGRADEALSFSLLAKAVAATDTPPRLVVLNSCESSGARKSLLKAGLIIVSMKTSVSDIAAVAFAPRFYAAIAGGQSVKMAFEQGKVAVEAASIRESDTPQLFHPKDVDPRKLFLT